MPRHSQRRPNAKTTRSTARSQSALASNQSALSTNNRTTFLAIALIVLLLGVAALFVNYNPRHYASSGQGLQLEISYRGQNGKTALDLLKGHYPVKSQHFNGVGDFVTSINNVVAPQNYFWAFEVNGKLSTVGAGQYVTKNTDTLTWKLEKIQ
jgi:hypothetical protein